MPRILLLLLCLPVFSMAQKLPSIDQKTKGLTKYEGFVNFYWDAGEGKILLEINTSDSEILYQTSLPAGLGSNDIGLDRGLLGASHIVKFTRVGKKVMMVQPNYDYRAITTNANEQKAVEQSFAQSTIWGFTAEAESGNSVLVDVTDFLLRDAMQVTNRLRRSNQGTYSMDKGRSAIYLPMTKNFPMNTEFEATVTFANNDGSSGRYVNEVTPSPEAITVRMHHSFVQLPDGNYQPRVYDPRSSFQSMSYFDYSTPVSEPIVKYFIQRHRLQKKDPNAARSEAVKPIVYYVDNGCPEPIRSALMEGAQWWNQAFEAAGFKNAFQVKVLPNDADPMDLRYNTINWVHRSTRGWSYGASVEDPRTGEIIKGNVSLGSLRVRQDYLIAAGLLAPYEKGKPANDKMMAMSLLRLKQLAAHEVGHTLGLNHNYSASSVNRSSVMDYPAPLATINGAGEIDLSNAYATGIGEWDKVSIAWGYTQFLQGTNEANALKAVLNNAYKSGLRYLTDQDARPASSGSSVAHLWDNGNNVVDGLKEVMKVRAKALQQFGQNNIVPGTPMAMLEDVLVPVYFYHRYQIEAVSKLVGGLDYTYALRGDGQTPTTALPKATQLNALNAIIDCIEPRVLSLPQNIVAIIPPRPSGYRNSRELFYGKTGGTLDALAPAETAADLPLSFLFVPERLNRMEQYGVKGGLGVAEMMTALINKTFKAPRLTGMEKLIQQQTEQVLLTYLLSATLNNNASFQVKADVGKALASVKQFAQSLLNTVTDLSYTAHLQLLLNRIKKPEDAKPTLHAEAPPGSPIGCDME